MRIDIRFLAFCIVLSANIGAAQKLQHPTRLWSVGPLSKGEPVMGVTFGSSGAMMTGPHVDSQTSSIFSATRSIAFAGDRIIVASQISFAPKQVYKLLSLDIKTGELKASRDFEGFGIRAIFPSNDGHVIVSGSSLLRLTPDLKEAGEVDFQSTEHRYGDVQNASPDGSTLGNATRPGYELIDSVSLKSTSLTNAPLADTSVSDKGVITNNVHWIGQYPKDLGFVTYYDSSGDHLLYHGKCGGRPQFLTSDIILEPGCKHPILIDTSGKQLLTMKASSPFSYAGASQNGERFALQLGGPSHERFVIYSVKTGEPITEVKAEQAPVEQSWTAFSADGKMFVVGSPLKLTLYKLP